MNIVIRVDASAQIGTGHVMRCLVLAEEMKEKGANVEFICREHSGNLIEFISKEKGFPVQPLPIDIKNGEKGGFETQYESWLGGTWESDAEFVSQVLQKRTQPVDWMIVDHYLLDSGWEQKLRPLVKKIMVIDDLADRSHDCDLLLDQNFHLKNNRYQSLIPKYCFQLLGPQYALLREEFRKARNNLRKRTGAIKRILVFFGGADLTNETKKTFEAICQLNRSDIAVDIVIGHANPHRKQLEQLISPFSNSKLHVQINNMAEFIAEADLGIGAGGTTIWERFCLGLPSLVMTIAENQEYVINNLHRQGYLTHLGKNQVVSSENICKNLKNALNSAEKLLSFVDKGIKLIDGNGVKKVLESILILGEYNLRQATYEDLLTYYHWANDKTVRRNSFSPERINLENHKTWFHEKLHNPDSFLYVLEKAGKSVGQIRFDVRENKAHISYLIDSSYRGLGLGKWIIELGIKKFIQDDSRKVIFQAVVKPDNIASHRIFYKTGFDKVIQKIETQNKQPATIYQYSLL